MLVYPASKLTMHISEPQAAIQPPGFYPTVFAVGFRPFFAAGALAGAGLMIVWVLIYRGLLSPKLTSVFDWHAHEMIFGYALAIIAGFLLTAVRNWTGLATAKGHALLFLLLLWAIPRFMPLIVGQPAWLAILDLCFPLCLAIALCLPIIRSKNWRNLVFIVIVSAFFLCNLGYYLATYKLIDIAAHEFLEFALELIMLIIAIIGSRVLPMFTRNGTAGAVAAQVPALAGKLIIGLGLLQLLSNLLSIPALTAGLSVIFAVCVVAYLAYCQGFAVWAKPLVWVLHLGYFGVALGFIFKACYLLGLLPESMYIHTFGVMAIGLMTLGFIGRVSLGHSGRALLTSKTMLASYVLMFIAAAVRIAAAYSPKLMLWDIAATCWSLALILFLLKFLPILLSPRADGKPA